MNPQAGDLVRYSSTDGNNRKHIGIGVITFTDYAWFFVEWFWVNDPYNSDPEKWRKDFQHVEFGIAKNFTVLS